jgi:hypothetical protein
MLDKISKHESRRMHHSTDHIYEENGEGLQGIMVGTDKKKIISAPELLADDYGHDNDDPDYMYNTSGDRIVC